MKDRSAWHDEKNTCWRHQDSASAGNYSVWKCNQIICSVAILWFYSLAIEQSIASVVAPFVIINHDILTPMWLYSLTWSYSSFLSAYPWLWPGLFHPLLSEWLDPVIVSCWLTPWGCIICTSTSMKTLCFYTEISQSDQLHQILKGLPSRRQSWTFLESPCGFRRSFVASWWPLSAALKRQTWH